MPRHLLRLLLPVVLVAAAFVACSAPPPEKPPAGNAHVQGHYDAKTGRLTAVTLDSNKNGKIDTWSYMDGARILRIEIDRDEDGKIDRWEYYGADQKLEKVGWSRANNGTPDSWGYPAPDGTMARVEQDSNGDGKVDKWETWSNGSVASVEFDTTGRGTPDRRLVYAPDGSVKAEALSTTKH